MSSRDSVALNSFSFPDANLLQQWNKLKKDWYSAKTVATNQEAIHRINLTNDGYDRTRAEGTESQKFMQQRLNRAKQQFNKCNKRLETTMNLIISFMDSNRDAETDAVQDDAYMRILTVCHEVLNEYQN